MGVEPYTLSDAAAAGDIDTVRELLAGGVDVDATDHSGCTALTCAAHADHTDVVSELLAHGADPNHRDNDTETVLMWAADHAGNVGVVRLLLRAGADVNARSDVEGTALSWAMRHGDIDMVRELLDTGADPNAPSVLMRAAYNGFACVVELLAERGADVRVTDADGQTALECARKRGNREVVELLRDLTPRDRA